MKRGNAAVVIRPALTGEAAVLSELALRSKGHWGYSPDFLAACRGELTYSVAEIGGRRLAFTVAEIAGTTVGFYALQRGAARELELEALFVEPGHIGTGVGKALMDHAKAAARAAGASTLVVQGDPNAGPFYEAAGGVQVGQRASASIPGRMLPVYAISIRGRADRDTAPK